MQRLVILGGGGHAKVLIELVRITGRFELVGLLDPSTRTGSILEVPVLGGDDRLSALYAEGVRHALVGVGGTGCNASRRRVFERLLHAAFDLPALVHPAASLSPSATLGAGTVVLASCVVSADARLGVNVIINSGAILEHDCVVGSHVHISPGATVCGAVSIGEMAHIGAGATIKQGVHIGAGALIAAGAVVVSDIPDWTLAAGVPARPIRQIAPTS